MNSGYIVSFTKEGKSEISNTILFSEHDAYQCAKSSGLNVTAKIFKFDLDLGKIILFDTSYIIPDFAELKKNSE